MRALQGIRFWGSSLLMLYEGDIDHGNDPKVDLRIIDFAHCYQEAAPGPDDGCLKGLLTLIECLKEISMSNTTRVSDDTGLYLDVFPDE